MTDTTGFQRVLGDVHGHYRSKRVRHEPPDELISDAVTARTWLPHVVRSGFFFGLFIFVGMIAFVVWMLALIAAVASSATESEFQQNAVNTVWINLSYALLVVQFLVLVAWVVILFLPLREPIAEYGLLIEGRAPASTLAYWWIMNTAHARQSPFSLQFGKVLGTPILLMQNNRERGLVVVRPVGTDLYVGWTMWRSRSTIVMIGHMFRDLFQNPLSADVRSASGRALRELIHSLTREGVQAAIVPPQIPDDLVRSQVDQLPDIDTSTGPIVAGTPQFQGHPQPHYQPPPVQ
jgi:hypothetical protein